MYSLDVLTAVVLFQNCFNVVLVRHGLSCFLAWQSESSLLVSEEDVILATRDIFKQI